MVDQWLKLAMKQGLLGKILIPFTYMDAFQIAMLCNITI